MATSSLPNGAKLVIVFEFDSLSLSNIFSSTNNALDVDGLAASIRNFRVSFSNPTCPRYEIDASHDWIGQYRTMQLFNNDVTKSNLGTCEFSSSGLPRFSVDLLQKWAVRDTISRLKALPQKSLLVDWDFTGVCLVEEDETNEAILFTTTET